jgi:hypothetical protein
MHHKHFKMLQLKGICLYHTNLSHSRASKLYMKRPPWAGAQLCTVLCGQRRHGLAVRALHFQRSRRLHFRVKQGPHRGVPAHPCSTSPRFLHSWHPESFSEISRMLQLMRGFVCICMPANVPRLCLLHSHAWILEKA